MNKLWIAGLVLTLNAVWGTAALAANAHGGSHGHAAHATATKKAAKTTGQHNKKNRTHKSTKKRCQNSTFCWR